MPAFNMRRDQTEGGGPPTGSLRISAAEFVVHNYGGNQNPTPALRLELATDSGKTLEQHWSCGGINRVGPTPDGKWLTAAPTTSSNAGMLFQRMGDLGVPDELFETEDIGDLVGFHAIWEQEEVERPGLNTTRISLPVEILAMPGKKAMATQRQAPKAPTAPGGFQVLEDTPTDLPWDEPSVPEVKSNAWWLEDVLMQMPDVCTIEEVHAKIRAQEGLGFDQVETVVGYSKTPNARKQIIQLGWNINGKQLVRNAV